MQESGIATVRDARVAKSSACPGTGSKKECRLGNEKNGNIANCLCVSLRLQPPEGLGELRLFFWKKRPAFSSLCLCFAEGNGWRDPGPRLFNTGMFSLGQSFMVYFFKRELRALPAVSIFGLPSCSSNSFLSCYQWLKLPTLFTFRPSEEEPPHSRIARRR